MRYPRILFVLFLALVATGLLPRTATHAAEWNLVFEDDFERDEIGENYDVLRADQARIEDGQLLLVGHGAQILIDRPLAMDHRLEFDSMAWPERAPCDLSVKMNEAYLLGFGAQDNRANHIWGFVTDHDPPFLIEPGKRYHMVAQREGKRISYEVNGTLILEATISDIRGGASYDRSGFITYAGMLVDNVKVYERSEPHPDTPFYVDELPALPIRREGRTLVAAEEVSPQARKAIDAFNSGDLDQAEALFEKVEDLRVQFTGLAHIYGDLNFRERYAYGGYTGGHDTNELQAFGEKWMAIAEENSDDPFFRTFKPAIKAFGSLLMRRNRGDDATLLVELGPDNNPFYHKALLYHARFTFWGGMEGASSEMKGKAQEMMRELAALWPELTILEEYAGEPVVWGEELNADPAAHPAWAAYLREAYARELAILGKFCRERQMPDGGFGGGWGDDVEMLRKWVPIAAISTAATDVRSGIRNLTDGIWNYCSTDGYHNGMADVQHSSEPTADTFPTALLLEHGDPRYLEYNLRSCKTLWEVTMGMDANGYPRFQSVIMGTSGVLGELGLHDRLHGGGDTGYHARAMKHFLWLAWYGNHDARDLYVDWADGWRHTAMLDNPDKPAGVIPGTIWYPTGDYNPPNGVPWYDPDQSYNYYGIMGMAGYIHQTCLNAYHFTGDRKFLHPFHRMMDYATYGPYGHDEGAEPPSDSWIRQNLAHLAGSTATAHYRMLTGEQVYDEYTRRFGTAPQVYPINKDLTEYEQRLQEAAESLRTNLTFWTSEVMATDRLHLPAVPEIWGAYTGAISTTVDAEFPTMGVTYETPDTNFAALVTENSNTRLRVRLYSFWDEPKEITLKLWRLTPGDYVLVQGETLPGERPFQSRYGWSEPAHRTILRKGDTVTITLPPQVVWTVDLRLHEAIEVPEAAPDLALHERDLTFDGDDLLAVIHNTGNSAAENFAVVLEKRAGENWTEVDRAMVERLSQPVEFSPFTETVRFADLKVGRRDQFRVRIDPADALFEIVETNNTALADTALFLSQVSLSQE